MTDLIDDLPDEVLMAGGGDMLAVPDPARSAYDNYDDPGDDLYDWEL